MLNRSEHSLFADLSIGRGVQPQFDFIHAGHQKYCSRGSTRCWEHKQCIDSVSPWL